MIPTTETDLKIDPVNGTKYSPNLYRWLTVRSRKHRGWTSRVYRDAKGALWIGYLDDLGRLVGQGLSAVLCSGAKAGTACWVHPGPLKEVTDFWAHYMRDGRCAIDASHSVSFLGDDTRWSVNGDTRSCQWCGKCTQVLRRWTQTIERETWDNTNTP